jgi:hypothetical protein
MNTPDNINDINQTMKQLHNNRMQICVLKISFIVNFTKGVATHVFNHELEQTFFKKAFNHCFTKIGGG